MFHKNGANIIRINARCRATYYVCSSYKHRPLLMERTLSLWFAREREGESVSKQDIIHMHEV